MRRAQQRNLLSDPAFPLKPRKITLHEFVLDALGDLDVRTNPMSAVGCVLKIK
jgi:hypothetical protein